MTIGGRELQTAERHGDFSDCFPWLVIAPQEKRKRKRREWRGPAVRRKGEKSVPRVPSRESSVDHSPADVDRRTGIQSCFHQIMRCPVRIVNTAKPIAEKRTLGNRIDGVEFETVFLGVAKSR